jgi:hypothetical protein
MNKWIIFDECLMWCFSFVNNPTEFTAQRYMRWVA